MISALPQQTHLPLKTLSNRRLIFSSYSASPDWLRSDYWTCETVNSAPAAERSVVAVHSERSSAAAVAVQPPGFARNSHAVLAFGLAESDAAVAAVSSFASCS